MELLLDTSTSLAIEASLCEPKLAIVGDTDSQDLTGFYDSFYDDFYE